MQRRILVFLVLFLSFSVFSSLQSFAQYTPKVFTVVVGSLKYGSNANNLVNQLSRKGISATVLKMNTQKGEMNRVCIGSFGSNREAQDAMRVLADNYSISESWVLALDENMAGRLTSFNPGSGSVVKKDNNSAKLKKQRAIAQKKKAELKKQQAIAEKKKAELEKQKVIAEKKKAELEKQKVIAEKKKAELEHQKIAAAQKKAQAEKQKQLAEKKKADAEAHRQRALEAKKKAEERKKAKLAAAAAAEKKSATAASTQKKAINQKPTDIQPDKSPTKTTAESKEGTTSTSTPPADLKKFMRFYKEFTEAVKANNIDKMNKAVDPIFGVYILYKPGKIVLTEKMKTFAAMKDLPFTTRTYKDLKNDMKLYTGSNLFGKIPDYDCQKGNYKKEGFYIDRIDGTSTNLTNVVNYSIAQTKAEPMSKQDIRKLGNIERSIKVAVRNTDAKVLYTMYFSFERGQWLLRIIDMTRDCN